MRNNIESFHVVGRDNQISYLMNKIFGLREEELMAADVLLFSGGEDIDPRLYGEKRLQGTYPNIERDKYEVEAYYAGIDRNVPMIGICRGAQLLHALNGNKLWQDVSGHATRKGQHQTLDLATGLWHVTTSCHHQMMRVDDINDPQNNFRIVALAAEATYKQNAEGIVFADPKRKMGSNISTLRTYRNDIEVLWYPETDTLCYQGHPEYLVKICTNYFRLLLERFKFITQERSNYARTQIFKQESTEAGVAAH